MELEKLKRREMKTEVLTIRITKSYSVWLRKNNVSPSKVLNTAIAELMQRKD